MTPAGAPKLFVFGPGYVGQAFARRMAAKGWSIGASARGAAPDLGGADAVLVTAPPDEAGCPGARAMGEALADVRPAWIGYLSSTGVYGDHAGRWVFEHSPLNAQSVVGARRVAAEAEWRALGERLGLAVARFRLPGIYGPGRSAFDRLRAGTARRVVRPGQVFSRIHVDDLAAALEASLARPRPDAAYNVCDDLPAPPQDVIAHAAALLGVEPPPETVFTEDATPAASRRFFAESKRVSNARAKAELAWRPAYPTYREGLAAILEVEKSDPSPPAGEGGPKGVG